MRIDIGAALKAPERTQIQKLFLAMFGVPVARMLEGASGQRVNAGDLVQVRFLSASRYLREANPRVRCLAGCEGRSAADAFLCMTCNGDRMFLGNRFWLAFADGDEAALKFGMLAAAFAAYFGMDIDHPKNPFRASRRYVSFAMGLFGESTPRIKSSPLITGSLAPARP